MNKAKYIVFKSMKPSMTKEMLWLDCIMVANHPGVWNDIHSNCGHMGYHSMHELTTFTTYTSFSVHQKTNVVEHTVPLLYLHA